MTLRKPGEVGERAYELPRALKAFGGGLDEVVGIGTVAGIECAAVDNGLDGLKCRPDSSDGVVHLVCHGAYGRSIAPPLGCPHLLVEAHEHKE